MDIDELLKTVPDNGTPIFVTKHGSHLYGLNTPESDVDYKGVYLPDTESLILGTAKHSKVYSTGSNHSKNSADDIDIEWFSIQKYLQLVMKGEMVVIDMLFANSNMAALMYCTPEWSEVTRHSHLLAQNNYKPYIGYITRQVSKYGIKGTRLGALQSVAKCAAAATAKRKANTECSNSKLVDIFDDLPTDGDFAYFTTENDQNFYVILGSKYQLSMPLDDFNDAMKTKLLKYGDRAKSAMDNDGVDFKAVSHAFRIFDQMHQLIQKGQINFPIADEATRTNILLIKQGKIPFNTLKPMLEDMIEKTLDISAKEDAPDNTDLCNNIILTIYKMY